MLILVSINFQLTTKFMTKKTQIVTLHHKILINKLKT